MTKRPENSSEFFNNWARTNRDPDGNYVEKYTIGGENDSYFQYIRLKYAEIHQILTEICIEIDEIIQKTQQIALENRKSGVKMGENMENESKTDILNNKNRENIAKNSEIEVKSTENPQKYKWISEKTNCFKCKSLDGKIFDHKPNVEEIAHPNCKCEVVEVSEIEAEMAESEREIEIGKRDDMVDYATKNAKYINKDGKLVHPDGSPAKYGYCARYVADALEQDGNIKIRRHQVGKNADSAYRYGEYIEKEGFIPIKSYMHKEQDVDSNRIVGEFPESYVPQKGDIIVFDKTDKHKDGHIAMYDGGQWVSDFKQRDAWGGDIRQEAPSYKIYRNPKWVE